MEVERKSEYFCRTEEGLGEVSLWLKFKADWHLAIRREIEGKEQCGMNSRQSKQVKKKCGDVKELLGRIAMAI